MMKMNNNRSYFTCFVILLLFCNLKASAQVQFPRQGKIEFEKKLNIHKEIEGDSFYDSFKDKISKFQTTYFNLYFKDGKTLYEKGRDNDEKIMYWDEDETTEDIVYADLENSTFVKKQKVFEETFLISDSIRTIKWQITTETRDIAGFSCRKATGIILDSVYIIAFYTDQIPVSGGPLSYAKLPGMILGVAIPRMNITIMATKLELIEPKTEKLMPPTSNRAKKTNYAGVIEQLRKSSLSGWGSYGRKYLLKSLL